MRFCFHREIEKEGGKEKKFHRSGNAAPVARRRESRNSTANTYYNMTNIDERNKERNSMDEDKSRTASDYFGKQNLSILSLFLAREIVI